MLKPARSRVYTILIDGVRRIVHKYGLVTYSVHSRGWHMRRHNVKEHLRHYKSGKVVTVRAHERGWVEKVPAKERRFTVNPDPVFFLEATNVN